MTENEKQIVDRTLGDIPYLADLQTKHSTHGCILFSAELYAAAKTLGADTHEEAISKARLWNAAPALVEALGELYGLLEENCGEAPWYNMGHARRARAALALAKGAQ